MKKHETSPMAIRPRASSNHTPPSPGYHSSSFGSISGSPVGVTGSPLVAMSLGAQSMMEAGLWSGSFGALPPEIEQGNVEYKV